ncbi:hypothetical protein OG955_45265 [Streptomyces sp. NBC_01602]|nr:hypothetical protein OG955_00095 [Streptomyces sp. NBC_01602]
MSPSGWEFGQADECVDAEVLEEEGFEVAAVDEFHAAGAVGEVPAGFAEPCGGDDDAFGGGFVVHDAGECAYGFGGHGVLGAFGLDDAQAADEGFLVDGHGVD